MSPGYFGVGIVAGKTPDNVGGLWRSAHAFGAAMIFTIAFRAPRQPTDTTRAARHVPLVTWADWETFCAHRPQECKLIAVECGEQHRPRPLTTFKHPDRALYVLGAEDRGLSRAVVEYCDQTIEIPTSHCLNVATAGSIVMYDRLLKTSA